MRRRGTRTVGYIGHTWVADVEQTIPAPVTVSVTPGTLVVTTGTLATAISESFNKPDAATLGPDLAWTQEVYAAGSFDWAVASNQGRFTANTVGTHRDLQFPDPNLATADGTVAVDIASTTRTGTGSYTISAGLIARGLVYSAGAEYRGYLVEFARDNITFGTDIWILAISRVDSTASSTVLASTGTVFANVLLPGRLSFNFIGPTLTATFTHGGSGPPLSVSTTDSTYTGGRVALLGRHVVPASASGSISVDNFAASNPFQTIFPAQTSVTATPGSLIVTTTGADQPITPEPEEVVVTPGTLTVTGDPTVQIIVPEPVTVTASSIVTVAIPAPPPAPNIVAGLVHARLAPQGPYEPATGPWYDITPYLSHQGVQIQRGRSDEFSHFQAATCSFELNNNQREFDPGNPTSPFAAVLRPRVRVEVYAVYGDASYTMFTGFIEEWPQSWTHTTGTVSVTATDAMAILSTDSSESGRSAFTLDDPFFGKLDNPLISLSGSLGQQLSGERIASILQLGGFSADLDIDPGLALLHETELEGNLLSAAQTAEDAEAGFLFVNRDGVWEFRDRHSRFNHPRMTVVQELFTDLDYGDIELDYSTTQIINDARVARSIPQTDIDFEGEQLESPPPQIVADDDSVLRFGRRIERLEIPVVSDGECQGRAQFLIDRYSEPKQRPGAIVIKPRRDLTTLLPAVLGLDLLDRVKITRQPRYISNPVGAEIVLIGQVEQIAHAVTNEDWATTITVSLLDVDPGSQPVRLDDPEFGKLGLYRLAY